MDQLVLPAFAMHIPRPPLTALVQCLWLAQGYVDYKRERVLPNGVIEVMVNLGNPHKVLEGENLSRETVHRDSWVAGIQNKHLIIEPTDGTDVMGIRFRPGGAWPLFGFPLNEVTDQVVPLELIDRTLFSAARDQLLRARTRGEKFQILEAALLRALDAEIAPHPAVTHVSRCIQRAAGDVRIAELVESTGLSHRRITRLFQRDVGMTPKQLAAVHRFQSVIRRVEHLLAPDWGEVALECGYYDQAHFNHEFKRLSGITPREYLATRVADFVNHAVAD